MNDDKPFVCPVADCGMRFINEDHLNVHSKKHEMSLALGSGGQSSNSPAHHFLDQTPTPTKFLKSCDEIGLFQELSSNPFDNAYKKALDSDPSPLPGPQTGELNTPTLILSDPMKHGVNPSLHVLAASPLSVEKTKGSEAPKPSPLAKSSGSKLVLDLSGKSVMSAQPTSSTKTVVTRNFTSQDADSTSTDSPSEDQTLIVGTTSHIPSTIQPKGKAEAPKHSMTSPAIGQSHLNMVSPEMVKKEVKEEPMTSGETDTSLSEQQQQCTMQVLLQLPDGKTVPISIPATINKFQYMGGAQPIHQPQLQQTIIQQQLPQPPPLQPAPSKTVTNTTSAASSQSTTMALKQRLKAQLQNQLSPTAKAAEINLPSQNSALISAQPATPSSVGSQVCMDNTSPIMMVDSPSSEMNLSDSSDYSIDSKRQKMSPENGDPEEKRRKFLERNRAAAARCRQKRKHWISNLERKADELQGTNVRLQSEVKLLRGEVAQLKTLLLAHKDCPVTQQQKSQGQLQHIILTDTSSLTSHDLAQVVPTSEENSEQINQAIVTFLQENQRDDLQGNHE